MKEIQGNLWDYHTTTGDTSYYRQSPIVITTNGEVKKDGGAVMGRGVALQARRKFKTLQWELGTRLKEIGNNVHYFPEYNLFTFPVKHHWREPASLDLIEKSSQELQTILKDTQNIIIYSVRPGCGNGGLDWKEVKPVVEPYFDKITIVELSLRKNW